MTSVSGRIVYMVQIEAIWREIVLESDFASHGCTKTFYAQKLLLITKG